MEDRWKELAVYRDALNREMRSLVGRFAPGPAELDRMLCYHLGWVDEDGHAAEVYPGKQVRPLLVLLSAESAGGKWEQALPAAAAIELLHNFSLIHDDIEDGSPLRRGRPSVWKLWGVSSAINAGDAMFALSYAALWSLVERGVPEYRVLQAMSLFARTGLELTRGQHLDMAFERVSVVSVDEYLAMIGAKSAALIAASAEMGALVSGAPDKVVQRYREFGYALGVAFQIRDDILGIWGEQRVTGKSTVTDIVSKKKTLPVLFGLEVSSELREIYAQPGLSDMDVARCVQILGECGAREYAVKLEEQYLERVGEVVGSLGGGGVSDVLLWLVEALLGRGF